MAHVKAVDAGEGHFGEGPGLAAVAQYVNSEWYWLCHSEYCNSLMCEKATAAEVDEHTIYNTASEMAKLRK
jgi:hypothetical protein